MRARRPSRDPCARSRGNFSVLVLAVTEAVCRGHELKLLTFVKDYQSMIGTLIGSLIGFSGVIIALICRSRPSAKPTTGLSSTAIMPTI